MGERVQVYSAVTGQLFRSIPLGQHPLTFKITPRTTSPGEFTPERSSSKTTPLTIPSEKGIGLRKELG